MERKTFFLSLLLAALLIPTPGRAGEAGDIRPFLNTGPWYPSDPVALGRMLDGFFQAVPQPQGSGPVRGIIAPHAGFAYSGLCAAHAYRALSPDQGIVRVILLGPAHRSAFYGACVADYTAYATPLGRVAVDTEVCRELAGKKLFQSDRAAMRFEHSLENQLPFLQKALAGSDFRIVPVLFGGLKKKDFPAMAEALSPYCDDRTLVVVSSDLTHYGENFSYTPFHRDLRGNLARLDRGFIATILDLDFDRCCAYREKTGITACGFVPIGVMIRLFEKRGLRSSLADYCKSGDLTGEYSTSVSYASLLFTAAARPENPIGLNREEQGLLLELARATLQSRLGNSRGPLPEEKRVSKHPKLQEKLGVFVTLRKKGELRGCIGSIIGSEPLYRGVEANAVHAAVDDPRFPALGENELAGVEIEISVMTPLRPVPDYRSIRLGTDGVVIRDRGAQAVFLPQVAEETGWTLDEFLANLCRKAGLDRDAYRRSRTMQFHVFQAQVFREKGQQK